MIDYKWLKYKIMDFQEKIEELRKIIKDNIEPLITSDYVHLDNPYHGNIGDILIWEGERQFLSSIKYKCLQSSSNSWCGKITSTPKPLYCLMVEVILVICIGSVKISV